MTHEEKAIQNFLTGYNCAQSVFLAFAPDLGLSDDLALRLSSSFGGGMGRLREVCGAVSGILMAAGVLYGYTSPTDDEAKAAHYALVQDLAGRNSSPGGAAMGAPLPSPAGRGKKHPGEGTPVISGPVYHTFCPAPTVFRLPSPLLPEAGGGKERFFTKIRESDIYTAAFS